MYENTKYMPFSLGTPPRYHCYYCPKSSDEDLLPHMLHVHLDREFTIRVRELDSANGVFLYRTKYFGVKCEFIKQKLDSGCSIQVNYESKRLAIKRKGGQIKTEHAPKVRIQEGVYDEMKTSTPLPHHSASDDDVVNQIVSMIPSVIDTMREMGRCDDMISILKSISNGSLDHNIVFHLLLDVGKLMRQNSVYSMRYSNETKEFWTLVQKLFNGKGLRFFAGTKGEGTDPRSGMRDDLDVALATV